MLHSTFNITSFIAQVLLHGDQPGDYWLLRGVSATDAEEEPSEASDEDDTDYSMSPTAQAIMLFERCFKKELNQADEDVDDWVQGGAMSRLSKSMHSSGSSARNFADTTIYGQISKNQKLSFVYDFVDATRSFDSLNFTRNQHEL